MWGFAIINFVWWIGIGHAGTLISAILLLLNQRWRNSINRFAEAMTLFAVACAGMFPLLHLGRPWLFYWLMPYPNTMGIEPQVPQPAGVGRVRGVHLRHRVAAVLVRGPDARPGHAARPHQEPGGAPALRLSGAWAGAARRGTGACTKPPTLLLAGIATPLVLSVHTVVSFDFTIGIVPGWHSTFFPPYFVAGAIYSGFAMVLALAIPLRSVYGLEGLITDKHLDNSAKVMLATGLIVAYAYILEAFTALVQRQRVRARGDGEPHDRAVRDAVLDAGGVQHAWRRNSLWIRRFRSTPWLLFVWSLIVLVGMWLERYVIIVSSLAQDNLVSSWRMFQATRWDWATYLGTIGLFLFLFFLFIRLLPMISIFEVRTLLPEAKVGDGEVADEDGDSRADGRVRQSHGAGGGGAGGAREGLPQAGRLLAVPHRGTERRAGSAPQQAAADRAGGRHHGRNRRATCCSTSSP